MDQALKIYRHDEVFVTESGYSFPQMEVAYRTWGRLNEARDNVVVIFHALTGNAHADDWFGGFFRNGFINPEKQFVVCANVPGSCYGSTGPLSINPQTGRRYLADFPKITLRDMVRLQQRLLDHLGVEGVQLAIGGSMGGMQALEFGLMDPRARALACLAMGKAHTPWAIGISHAQRQAIERDPRWRDGYYDPQDPPSDGLAVARMMAMTSYRCPENYERKFGRRLQDDHSDLFQVESYLNYQGDKLTRRFDPLSYVRLTQAMDSHDVSRGREPFETVLHRLQVPVLVAGFSSDLLYPVAEQRELARLLPEAVYKEVETPYGHDAFLIEFDRLNAIISTFLKQYTPTPQQS